VSDPPIRVLLVEDESEVRAVAASVLSSFGHQVTAVANGAEALAALDVAQPDVIVSDVRMPVVDGFQLLQRVRADPLWHEIPFIIISAKAESADLRMGMSLGADDYVTKPYRPEDIRRAIEIRVLRAKQVSDTIARNQRLLTHILPHELRTPLMGVIGYADLMVDTASEGRTLSAAELSEYGRMLQLSGARLLRIVENLLFWARLEAPREAHGRHGRAQEEVTPASLVQLAEAVARQYGRPFDVAVDCTAGARVQVVTTGFAFVVRHLVENAFKCSLPGTSVRVAAHAGSRVFVLSVRDAGRGMTRDQIARVLAFRPFDGQGIGGEGGTGMGLMLAATFARASGGHLGLEGGAEGKGLVVELSLPLAAGPAPA
jgi:CheY-like chemotaxis protein